MDVTPAPPIDDARGPRASSDVERLLHRLAVWAVFGLVGVAVGVGGLAARRWAWDQTEPIRFQADINNAFLQGTRTLGVGYLDRYDNDATGPIIPWGAGPMSLDYGPGRLAVATAWAHWVRTRVTAPSLGPDRLTGQWQVNFYARARQLGRTYELCQPLLRVNLTGEALSAAAMFLLVWRYTSDRGRRPVRGAVLAMASASLFWLDPALVWNAHCWPQWDSWVLPFLLWGLLLASVDLWFCAGLAMAAGAMFKGQVLFGSGMFLLWPLWQGRPGASVRWAVGLAAGVAGLTAVWSLRVPGELVGDAYVDGHVNAAAVAWVAGMGLAFALAASAVWPWWERWASRAAAPAAEAPDVGPGLRPLDYEPRRRPSAWAVWTRVGLGAAAVLFATVPLRHADVPRAWLAVAAAAVGLGGLLWVLPARSLGHAAAGWVAAAVLLCVPLFGGSGQWYLTGIAHGTTARNMLSVGENNNLANLLGTIWHWDLQDPAVTLPAGRVANAVAAFLRAIDRHVDLPPGRPVALPLKYLLVIVWLAALVPCSWAAARHDRRRDARFLLAVAAPWVVMFAVLGQMHQRYLLWGAALTCMAAAVSPGLVVLHLLLSVVSAGQEMLSMVNRQSGGGWGDSQLYRLVHGWTPGMGWAVLLTAGVFVYQAVLPGRRRDPAPASPVGQGGPDLGPAEEPPHDGRQD